MPRKRVGSKKKLTGLTEEQELELIVFLQTENADQQYIKEMKGLWIDNREWIITKYYFDAKDMVNPGRRPAAWWAFEFKGEKQQTERPVYERNTDELLGYQMDEEENWETLKRYNLLWDWEKEAVKNKKLKVFKMWADEFERWREGGRCRGKD